MRENCYLFFDPQTRDCAIIDPGDEGDFITEEILRLQLKPVCIILTHGHFDHCLACLELKLNFNLPIYLNPQDVFLYQNAAKSAARFSSAPPLKLPPSQSLPNSLKIGSAMLTVIHTPGHTPGSVCLYSKPHLFSGDTLFADSVGAVDHAYSSAKDLQKSLKTIRKLPSGTECFSGHGESFLL